MYQKNLTSSYNNELVNLINDKFNACCFTFATKLISMAPLRYFKFSR